MNANFSFSVKQITSELSKLSIEVGLSKYILLYRAIKNCIQKKELPNHWVLPSTRELAKELNYSRTTVLKAYELLLLEKLIVGKQGSGYKVQLDVVDIQVVSKPSKEVDLSQYPDISQKGQAFLENVKILNRQRDNAIAFKPGLPPIDIFPINKWKNLLNNYWRYIKSNELSYGPATGVSLLKTEISHYLQVSRNVQCEPDQIIVVSGSLQSMYLIANALLNPGDHVVLEDPTFPNVHSILKSFSTQMHPVSIDEEGIDVEKLKKLYKYQPKLLHVTPSDHYPLGVKMSLDRRLQLLDWASQNKCYVIENDYENEVSNHLQSLPTLYSLDNESRCIYLGTFNRLLYPSIRLGYMVVPKHLIKVFEALQEHSHRFVSTITQLVMGQFIEKNYLYQHLKNLNETAIERDRLFTQIFNEKVQDLELINKNYNSLHKVAVFKGQVSKSKETELISRLAENEIAAFSLSKCYVQHSPTTGLILGYSTVRPALLKQKAHQMARIINEF